MKVKPAHIANKRAGDALKHYPLQSKKVYLDLHGYRGVKTLEEDLSLLGGIVEKCFSKEISVLITNRGTESDYKDHHKRHATSSGDSPSPATPSPFNVSAFAGGGLTSPPAESPSSAASTTRPLTRGKSLLQAANTTKHYGTTDVLQSARTWRIKIVHVSAVERWLRRELNKLPEALLKKKDKTSRRCKTNGERRVKFNGDYLKIEDTQCVYKPVYKEFTAFPKPAIHIAATAFTRSPFDVHHVKTKKSKQAAAKKTTRRAVRGNSKVDDTAEDLGNGHDLSAAEHDRGGGGAAQKPGYCEICSTRYTSLAKHLSTNEHMQFASNNDNYQTLATIMEQGLSIEMFVSRVLQSLEQTTRHTANRNTSTSSTVTKSTSTNILRKQRSTTKLSKETQQKPTQATHQLQHQSKEVLSSSPHKSQRQRLNQSDGKTLVSPSKSQRSTRHYKLSTTSLTTASTNTELNTSAVPKASVKDVSVVCAVTDECTYSKVTEQPVLQQSSPFVTTPTDDESTINSVARRQTKELSVDIDDVSQQNSDGISPGVVDGCVEDGPVEKEKHSQPSTVKGHKLSLLDDVSCDSSDVFTPETNSRNKKRQLRSASDGLLSKNAENHQKSKQHKGKTNSNTVLKRVFDSVAVSPKPSSKCRKRVSVSDTTSTSARNTHSKSCSSVSDTCDASLNMNVTVSTKNTGEIKVLNDAESCLSNTPTDMPKKVAPKEEDKKDESIAECAFSSSSGRVLRTTPGRCSVAAEKRAATLHVAETPPKRSTVAATVGITRTPTKSCTTPKKCYMFPSPIRSSPKMPKANRQEVLCSTPAKENAHNIHDFTLKTSPVQKVLLSESPGRALRFTPERLSRKNMKDEKQEASHNVRESSSSRKCNEEVKGKINPKKCLNDSFLMEDLSLRKSKSNNTKSAIDSHEVASCPSQPILSPSKVCTSTSKLQGIARFTDTQRIVVTALAKSDKQKSVTDDICSTITGEPEISKSTCSESEISKSKHTVATVDETHDEAYTTASSQSQPHNWSVLSDRSMAKLLASDGEDEDAFAGFTDDDITQPTQLGNVSYECVPDAFDCSSDEENGTCEHHVSESISVSAGVNSAAAPTANDSDEDVVFNYQSKSRKQLALRRSPRKHCTNKQPMLEGQDEKPRMDLKRDRQTVTQSCDDISSKTRSFSTSSDKENIVPTLLRNHMLTKKARSSLDYISPESTKAIQSSDKLKMNTSDAHGSTTDNHSSDTKTSSVLSMSGVCSTSITSGTTTSSSSSHPGGGGGDGARRRASVSGDGSVFATPSSTHVTAAGTPGSTPDNTLGYVHGKAKKSCYHGDQRMSHSLSASLDMDKFITDRQEAESPKGQTSSTRRRFFCGQSRVQKSFSLPHINHALNKGKVSLINKSPSSSKKWKAMSPRSTKSSSSPRSTKTSKPASPFSAKKVHKKLSSDTKHKEVKRRLPPMTSGLNYRRSTGNQERDKMSPTVCTVPGLKKNASLAEDGMKPTRVYKLHKSKFSPVKKPKSAGSYSVYDERFI